MQNSLNACRWVYNKVLETRKEAWEQRRENVGRYDTVKMLPGWKVEHPFLKDAYSQVLQEVCTRVDLAFRALNHAYQRAANRRRDFAHKESRKLVNQYQFIAFEDLDIVNMQASGWKSINQGIADVAWNQFVQFAQYKAEEAGRGVVLVDPSGTTQQCSGCGETVPKDLSVRKHECPACGLSRDRDHNAALNILSRGLATLPFGARNSPMNGGE